MTPYGDVDKHKVFLRQLRSDSVEVDVGDLLSSSALSRRLQGASQVFVKPNLVSDVPEYIQAGSNTDIRVLGGLLAHLTDCRVKVLVGESEVGTRLKGRRLDRALAHMGLYDLQERYAFEIVNLTEAPQVQVGIPDARVLRSVKLSTPLLDSDLIINVPKLKTHKYAVITCSLKNMFGAIPDPMRIRYHHSLDWVLADLNSLFERKMYVLVDGIRAMEGQGPLYGTPVEMNLLLAAHSPGAADTVAAQLMGFSPDTIPHLHNFMTAYSEVPASAIRIDGPDPADLARPFRPARRSMYVRFESWMCRHPAIVNIIFSDSFRRYVSRPLHPVLSRLRGGSYNWYDS